MEDLKNTLNLPRTDFPMRANLVQSEPERIAFWEKEDFYGRRVRANEGNEPFILHDGPPFTNGDVHVGTALNKVVKDTILRFRAMQGRFCPYVPGWDCHGLPIEHKVARRLREEGRELDAAGMREACEAFSRDYIEVQRTQFRRLGILADWAREYRTMDPAYEAVILETFADFVEAGLVYRSKKPVYWSIPCETALAEAEIEYRPHVSPAVHVAFPVSADPDGLLPNGTSVVIWTTTPWTLPANLAIAVNPALDYVVCSGASGSFLVAASRVEAFAGECGMEGFTLSPPVPGARLRGIVCRHCFLDRDSPLITADYVSDDAGTGCVHIAPGHGLDDYFVGLENGLEVYCPVNDQGRYLDDGRLPARLVGKSVLETGGRDSEANREVLAILGETGRLLGHRPHDHSYPHCWRSKTPVVFRAMDQWFVRLDEGGLRERTLAAVDAVQWDPEWGRLRIRGAVKDRPDWCISRQRTWGVPLPAFFNEEGEALLDPKIIRGVAAKVAKHGAGIWFTASPGEILDGVALPGGWDVASLRPGGDTLDVWIDSGCSHRAVLQRTEGLRWPADLYIEGSDQHRGWFQSSLWTGMVADGAPPYRHIVTHGFVVGPDKRKISKSDGKPQTADDYVGRYGADVIRLWICSENYREDIPLSEDILKNVAQTYRNIRNTLRFQLGNLHDFDPAVDATAPDDLDGLDRWCLAETSRLVAEVTRACEGYEFHAAYQSLARFCSNVLSSTYHDILKDRLYTLAPMDPLRRSSQTVLHQVCDTLCRLLAPLLPFTADEAWAHLHGGKAFHRDGVHLATWPIPVPESEEAPGVEAVSRLLAFKASHVNVALEKARGSKEIASSLDAALTIHGDPGDPEIGFLRSQLDRLSEIFIVSRVDLCDAPGADLSVTASHAPGVRCPRSWRWVPSLVSTAEWGEVSPRCAEALRLMRQSAGSPVPSGDPEQ